MLCPLLPVIRAILVIPSAPHHSQSLRHQQSLLTLTMCKALGQVLGHKGEQGTDPALKEVLERETDI